MTDQPPMPPPTAPPSDAPGDAPKPATKARGCLGGLALLLVLGLIGGGIWFVNNKHSQSELKNAAVGDCVWRDTTAYRIGDCSAADVTYRVVGVDQPDEDHCIDIPGTSTTDTLVMGRYVCIGKKGVDPATTINGIAVGECVTVVKDEATKVPCSTEGADKVLLVLKDVGKTAVSTSDDPVFGNKCITEGAAGTTSSYAWGIEPTGAGAPISLAWDRVLCLGPVTKA